MFFLLSLLFRLPLLHAHRCPLHFHGDKWNVLLRVPPMTLTTFYHASSTVTSLFLSFLIQELFKSVLSLKYHLPPPICLCFPRQSSQSVTAACDQSWLAVAHRDVHPINNMIVQAGDGHDIHVTIHSPAEVRTHAGLRSCPAALTGRR